MSLNQLTNFNENAENNLNIACHDLQVTCSNGDLLSLRPQSKGLLNQVLASSGQGTIDFITMGGGSIGNMTFSGSSAIGRHYRAGDNSGVNVVQSSLTETKDDFDFANKSVSNISEIITPNLGVQTSGNINIETSDLNIESSANTNFINSGNLQFQTFGNYTVQTPNNMILTTPQIETNEILLGSIVNNNNLLSSQFIQMKNEDNNFNTLTPSKCEIKDVSEKSTLNSSGLSFQSILTPANQTIYGAVSIFKDSNSQTIDNIINKTQNLVDGTLQGINSIANTTGTLSLSSPFTVDIDTNVTNLNNSTLQTNASVTANSFIKIGSLPNRVLMSDGSTQPYNAGSGNSNYYIYENDTTTTVPPSQAGRINFNNSVQQNATTVWINHLTNDSNGGTDIDPFFELILAGSDILYIQDRSNSTNYIKFNILTKVIIPNNYMTLGVAFLSGEGTGLTSFGNNHPIFFSIFNNIPQIDTRLDALENKTQYQSTPIANQTNFTGAVLADSIKKTGGLSTEYLMASGDTISGLYNLSSVGTGQTLVNSGSGTDFKTKSLIAGSNISLSSNSDELTITGTTPPSTLASVGVGTSLINSSTFPNFSLKSLTVQSGMFLNDTGNTIYLGVSNPSTNISLTSVGTGSSLIPTTSSNPNFQVKSIVQGGGMSILDNANDITIINNSPSTLITLGTAGTGTSLINSTLSSNPNFYIKSLAVGTGLSLLDSANTVTLTNTEPSSIITFSNAGAGNSLISSSTNPSFSTKGLIAGSNINITSNSTDLTIGIGALSVPSIQLTSGVVANSQPYINSSNQIVSSSTNLYCQSGVDNLQTVVSNITGGNNYSIQLSSGTHTVTNLVLDRLSYSLSGTTCPQLLPNTTITSNITLGSTLNLTGVIKFSNIIFNGTFTFLSNATTQACQYSFYNCQFNSTITFPSLISGTTGYINFYDCNIVATTMTFNNIICSYSFIRTTFNNTAITNNSPAGSLVFESCKNLNSLTVTNATYRDMNYLASGTNTLTATGLTLAGASSSFIMGNGSLNATRYNYCQALGVGVVNSSGTTELIMNPTATVGSYTYSDPVIGVIREWTFCGTQNRSAGGASTYTLRHKTNGTENMALTMPATTTTALNNIPFTLRFRVIRTTATSVTWFGNWVDQERTWSFYTTQNNTGGIVGLNVSAAYTITFQSNVATSTISIKNVDISNIYSG